MLGITNGQSGAYTKAQTDAKLSAPTLAAIPGEGTLTYQEKGTTYSFRIGQFCRVADPEADEGYAFFQLYDITADGKAVWGQGGGGGDMREKVRINLTSNQPQPDSALAGAIVTVTDNTLGQEVYRGAWQGTEILAKVTALSAYTVEVSEVEGYATPAAQNFEASIQGERNVTMTYNTCVLTVHLASNQADKSDISAATATVAYGGKSTTIQSGGSVKVPVGAQATVSASGVEYYDTPEDVTFTAETASKEVTMTYHTCVLTVHISGLENGDTANATVSFGETSLTVESGGSVKVPYAQQVTVSCPDVEGYATPADAVFTPSEASKSVTMAYVASALKVIIASNQPDKTDIAGLKATVSYGSTSVQVSSGQTVAIPVNQQVTISFPALSGYKKPSDITLTNTGGLVEKTGTYQTEVVTVTVNADNAASMSGQKVTINGTEHTYQGSPISVKIPFGTQYTISVNAKEQYITPQPQIVTAGQASRAVTMTYAYNPIKYNYITLNQTVTDPATMLSGDINGEVVQYIRQNSHRVLGKYTGNGKMTYCRLKDDDGTKYHDGSAAVLTGNEGDVFLKLPEFYWQCVTTGTDIYKIGLAYGGNPGTGWKKWEGEKNLIGVYEAYETGSKTYSRSGVTSTGNVSQANFKAHARSRGTGFMIEDWNWHCMMAMLYYCQYGHMNCQDKIGKGTNSYTKTTGATNALGMEDTVAGGNGDSNSINFWGLENWWGNKYEWIEGIEFNNGTATITMPDGTTRTVQGYNVTGYYPTKMVLGEFFDLIAKDSAGSDSTGYCDYYYLSTSDTSRVVLRSVSYSYTSGGVACAYAADDSSYTDSSDGSRLAFRGDLVEASSVSAFKSLAMAG